MPALFNHYSEGSGSADETLMNHATSFTVAPGMVLNLTHFTGTCSGSGAIKIREHDVAGPPRYKLLFSDADKTLADGGIERPIFFENTRQVPLTVVVTQKGAFEFSLFISGYLEPVSTVTPDPP